MISCADILLEESQDTKSESGIIGFQFRCEFNAGDTGCRFFDDDGYQLTDDGSVCSIETILFEPDPGCDSYTCLNLQYLLKDSYQVAIPTSIHL